MTPTLHSIHVGRPKDISLMEGEERVGRVWRTSLFKERVHGPIYLRRLGFEGDGQADLKHHGGPDKAVCVYPMGRYAHWQERLGRELPAGAFGENLCVLGQDEDSVCLGDIFQLGGARVQATQPRSPCWKIARRWHASLALWFQSTGFTGWYCRVLELGWVHAGARVELLERSLGHWTIQRLNLIRYHDAAEPGELMALARCEVLSAGWRARFERGLVQGDSADRLRLHGPES